MGQLRLQATTFHRDVRVKGEVGQAAHDRLLGTPISLISAQEIPNCVVMQSNHHDHDIPFSGLLPNP